MRSPAIITGCHFAAILKVMGWGGMGWSGWGGGSVGAVNVAPLQSSHGVTLLLCVADRRYWLKVAQKLLKAEGVGGIGRGPGAGGEGKGSVEAMSAPWSP